MKLSVMTYNICSGKDFSENTNITADGNSVYNIDACCKVIKDISPDICGINEINEFLPEFCKGMPKGEFSSENQAAYLAEKTGLGNHAFGEAVCFEKRGGYGNALISKYKIKSVRVHKIPEPDFFDEFGYYESRAIAELLLDVAGGITVFVTHLGLNDEEKQKGIEKLVELIKKTDTPILLMGDFNMRPADWRLDRIREHLCDITPDADGYVHTFPSWSKSDNLILDRSLNPCKIDYIFASNHFSKLSCTVIDARASDHKPMLALFEI